MHISPIFLLYEVNEIKKAQLELHMQQHKNLHAHKTLIHEYIIKPMQLNIFFISLDIYS